MNINCRPKMGKDQSLEINPICDAIEWQNVKTEFIQTKQGTAAKIISDGSWMLSDHEDCKVVTSK